ncbi:MAG: GIY-YIG nuclease family protein [Clostridia bacterium]|nr:GIY-YIG nuclease family protein [Clostridia bacterium]
MNPTKGVIYILTNPSFSDYVKIGYADDIDSRLRQLNRSECIPFAFRVYATYEVNSRLSDLKIHTIIDKLNPNLRSIDNFNGQKRVREFYAMSPEDAYSILEAIAEIHGCADKLKLIPLSNADVDAEGVAKEIVEERKSKAAPFSFSMCNIPIGATLQFWRTATQETNFTCTVVDNRRVEYQGKIYSLSSLAAKLSNVLYPVHGPCYFKYNGEWLNDIRDRLED